MFSDAALAVAMTDAIALKLPWLSAGAPRNLFLVALFGFLAVMNIASLKAGIGVIWL